MTMLNAKNKKGIVLLLTFIIMITLTVITVVFLYMISIEIKNAGYELSDSQALWIADGGIQQVIYKVKSDAAYKASPTTLSGNLGAGSYSATVTKNGSDYNVTSVGTVGTAKRKITCVVQQTGSPFTYAGFGNSSVTMSDSTFIDSYNSSLGLYNVNGNIGYNGDIGGNANISMKNSAYINGDASTGPGGSFNDPTHKYVYGTVTHTNNISLPTVIVPSTLTGLVSGGEIDLNNRATMTLNSGNYKFSKIELENGATLTINATTAPVYIYLTGDHSSVDIANQASIIIPATNTQPVIFYTDGETSISNGSVVNSSYLPSNFQLYNTGSSSVNIANSGSFYGAIYAPLASVNMSNSSTIYGSIISGSLTMANTAAIHYDQALATTTTSFGAGAYSAKSWHEVVPAS